MAYDNTNAFCDDDDRPDGGHGYLTSAEIDDDGRCRKCQTDPAPEHPADCAFCAAGEGGIHNYEPPKES